MKLLVVLICLIGVVGGSAPLYAIEDLTLTAPITHPSTTRWRVSKLTLDAFNSEVRAEFIDPDTARTVTCFVQGDSAASLLSTLNTANLTSNSLQKRALTWAQGTGCLGAGSIGGSPQ